MNKTYARIICTTMTKSFFCKIFSQGPGPNSVRDVRRRLVVGLGFPPLAVIWPGDTSHSGKTDARLFCPDWEGCKSQMVPVLTTAAEGMGTHQEKFGFGFVSSSDGKEKVKSFQGLILKEGERVAWMRWTQIKTVLSQGRICQWNDNSHIYIVGAYLFQTKSWKHVKAHWHITKPVLSSCLSLYKAVNIG